MEEPFRLLATVAQAEVQTESPARMLAKGTNEVPEHTAPGLAVESVNTVRVPM